MKAGFFKTFVIMIGVSIVSLIAGTQLNQAVYGSAQAKARESSFAAVQAAWGVVDLLRTDLQRAGYYENSSSKPGLHVKMTHPSPLKVKVASDVLVFQSADGQETIVYRFVNGQLFRSSGQNPKIVLDRIADFGFRQVLDGQVINVTFSVGVSPEYEVSSSVLHFTGRFRRAEES